MFKKVQKYKIKIKSENILCNLRIEELAGLKRSSTQDMVLEKAKELNVEILRNKSGDIALVLIIFPVQFAYLIKNDEYCISLTEFGCFFCL